MHSRQGSVHSLNSSSSKQRYTFPKSPRFDKIVSESTDSFYNLPSIKSRRSTSFGFGQKDIGMQTKKVCPSPEAYRIKSQFDNQGKRKGFSFGQGRQDMQLTGPLSESITKKFIPSPNLYYPKPSSQAFNITLKSRLKDRSLQQLQKNPGPGTYNLQQMGHKNYYITSGNRNKINFKINSSARPETMAEAKYNNTKLGPGSYQLTADDISPDGRYKRSKNKNSKAPKFSKSSRPEPIIKHMITTPGPTKYEKYSEFDN